MDKYQIYTALQNMDRFGGSFVQALACCYSLADPDNDDLIDTETCWFWREPTVDEYAKDELEKNG